MKRIGYLLISAGFLAGAYFSALDAERVTWRIVAPSLLVGLAGVALVQKTLHSRRTAVHAVHANVRKVRQSLEAIAANIERLDRDKHQLDVYEIHRRIDDLFLDDLATFVDHRESIAHAFGLQAYANVMTHFASGERCLNRSWSASTDGYIDEVLAYLERANGQFKEALDLLRSLKPPTEPN